MDTTPPGPDISKGPLMIGVTILFHVISLSIFGARIYTRVIPTIRLGLDDYLITAAVAFDLLEWSLLVVGISYGVGRHDYYLTPDQLMLAEKFLFLSQPPYAWSLAFSKMSIAWMLIRIQRDQRSWAIFLYSMMIFSGLIAITMNAFQFSSCKPLSAVWDHATPGAVCMPPSVSHISIYVTAAMTILTDVILSLLPITFIVNIQRPLREKLALSFVMGLGILASSASIVKTTLVKNYGITGDDLMDSVGITIWSILEMQLAIIASCIPCLKQLFEKILRRVGILSAHNTVSRTGYLTHTYDNINFKTSIKANTTRVDDSASQELIIEHTSGIQLETTVSVHSFSKGSVENDAT